MVGKSRLFSSAGQISAIRVTSMIIIDTHMHLGTSRFSGVTTTEDDILQAMERHRVAAGLIMPQPTLEDVPAVHRSIARFAAAHPGRIYGIASIDPWLEAAEYRRQMAVCMEDYGFVAIKLHPLGHNISPLSSYCDKVYEAAAFYGVPVIVHTGLGAPNALPALVIEPARRFPQVTFILAHAGFAVYTDEAIVAAGVCGNIVLEPSWCPVYAVKRMLDKLGAGRLIMGSDHLDNLPVELAKYQSAVPNEEVRSRILYHNPQQLFKLQVPASAIPHASS